MSKPLSPVVGHSLGEALAKTPALLGLRSLRICRMLTASASSIGSTTRDGNATAFDVTTKGILHAVFERREFWRLRDAAGKPPGLMGWWPSRAVTFLENHDTVRPPHLFLNPYNQP